MNHRRKRIFDMFQNRYDEHIHEMEETMEILLMKQQNRIINDYLIMYEL
jgi:hypothetical protein